MFGGKVIVTDRIPQDDAMYQVTIHISDLVLVELTKEQFQQFCDWNQQLELLGFTDWIRVTRWCDYPHCDKVFVIQTNEVVKPSLFGQALPYTAEAI